MNPQAVQEFCTKTFLIPFESYAIALPDGSCEAYADPASLMGKLGAKRLTDRSRKPDGSPWTREDGLPWTIGYGSTFDDEGVTVMPGDVWSHEKAVRVKQIVTAKFLKNLLALSPSLITEPVERVAAILSWVYNCGIGSYRISTFKKKIDEKDWDLAAEECLKWDKAQGKKLKGLTRRRTLEASYIK